METPAGGPSPKRVTVILGPSGGGDHVPNGRSNADGTLLIEDVTPDTYRITPPYGRAIPTTSRPSK